MDYTSSSLCATQLSLPTPSVSRSLRPLTALARAPLSCPAPLLFPPSLTTTSVGPAPSRSRCRQLLVRARPPDAASARAGGAQPDAQLRPHALRGHEGLLAGHRVTGARRRGPRACRSPIPWSSDPSDPVLCPLPFPLPFPAPPCSVSFPAHVSSADLAARDCEGPHPVPHRRLHRLPQVERS